MPVAVGQLFGTAMQTSGQHCTAISRVLVKNDLAESTKSLLAERADAILLGSGMNSDTQMGPLCNRAHWEGVCANTEKAMAEGAIPLAGCSAVEGAGEQGR